MNEIEVLHISFTMNDIDSLLEEEEEVVFFLQIGALIQEIISLQKWVHMSSHGVAEKWPRRAENAQALYFFRLLAGTLYEAWKTLQSDRYRAVKEKYKPELDDNTLEATNKLIAYFKKDNNLCKKIRNNHSHHYNYGEIRKIIRQWPPGERLDLIFAQKYANWRFLATDTITTFAILGITDPESELKKYFSEVSEIAQCFIDLTGSYVWLILKSIQSNKNFKGVNLVIDNVPHLDDIRLNYFVVE